MKPYLLLCCYSITYSGSLEVLFVRTLCYRWLDTCCRLGQTLLTANAMPVVPVSNERNWNSNTTSFELSIALPSAKELIALQTAQGLRIAFIKGNHCYCISSIQTKILQIESLESTLLILFTVHNNRKRFFLFLSRNKFLPGSFVFLSL